VVSHLEGTLFARISLLEKRRDLTPISRCKIHPYSYQVGKRTLLVLSLVICLYFRFKVAFTSCLVIGKAARWGDIPQRELQTPPGIGDIPKIRACGPHPEPPYSENVPHPRALPYTKSP
jgi:hypothetical protein